MSAGIIAAHYVAGGGGGGATFALRDSNASTANVTSYASASFTPTAGELLVVCVSSSATAAAGSVTASANGITFAKVQQGVYNGSFSSAYLFVANQLVPGSPVAMTVTFDCTGDAATGAIVSTLALAGMTKVGTAAIKQSGKADNQSGGTPTVSLGGAVQSTNPILGCISGTALIAQPTGFTNRVGASYATPTTTIQVDTLDTGHSGSAVTWASAIANFWGAVAAEFDSTP